MKILKQLVIYILISLQFYCSEETATTPTRKIKSRDKSNEIKNESTQIIGNNLNDKNKKCKVLIDDLYINNDGTSIDPYSIKSDNDPYYEKVNDWTKRDNSDDPNRKLEKFSIYKQRIIQDWTNHSEMNCDVTDEESKQRAMKQLKAQQQCGQEDCTINIADLLKLDYIAKTVDFVNSYKREIFYLAYNTFNYRYFLFENKRDTYVSNVYRRIQNQDKSNDSISIMIHFQSDFTNYYLRYLIPNSIFFYTKDISNYQLSKEEESQLKNMYKPENYNNPEKMKYLKQLEAKNNIYEYKMIVFKPLKGTEHLENTLGLNLVSDDKFPDVKKKLPLVSKNISNCVQINKKNYSIYFPDAIDEVTKESSNGQSIDSKKICEDSKDPRIQKVIQFLDANL